MAEPPLIEFEASEDMGWDDASEEVRFVVLVDGGEVLCRVSRDWIEENLDVVPSPEACLTAAKENFDLIQREIEGRIVAGAIDADGSVLLA